MTATFQIYAYIFYNNSRINYLQKIITFPIKYKHAYLSQVPKRKLYENPASLSFKRTLQSWTPFHTTKNFTEIQIKIEAVNMSDQEDQGKLNLQYSERLVKNIKD